MAENELSQICCRVIHVGLQNSWCRAAYGVVIPANFWFFKLKCKALPHNYPSQNSILLQVSGLLPKPLQPRSKVRILTESLTLRTCEKNGFVRAPTQIWCSPEHNTARLFLALFYQRSYATFVDEACCWYSVTFVMNCNKQDGTLVCQMVPSLQHWICAKGCSAEDGRMQCSGWGFPFDRRGTHHGCNTLRLSQKQQVPNERPFWNDREETANVQ